MCFWKKKCLSVLVDLCLITQRGYSTSTELWCWVSLIFSPLDGYINENMSVDGERYRFGCHFIYQDNCFSLTAIIKKCVFFILSLNVNYPSIAGVTLVIGFPFFDVTADQSCSLSPCSVSTISAGSVWRNGKSIAHLQGATIAALAMRSSSRWRSSQRRWLKRYMHTL